MHQKAYFSTWSVSTHCSVAKCGTLWHFCSFPWRGTVQTDTRTFQNFPLRGHPETTNLYDITSKRTACISLISIKAPSFSKFKSWSESYLKYLYKVDLLKKLSDYDCNIADCRADKGVREVSLERLFSVLVKYCKYIRPRKRQLG